HVNWPAVTNVDFATGLLAGSFNRFALSFDQRTLFTTEGSSVVVRDSRSGDVLQQLTGLGGIVSIAATADGNLWTLTSDNTVALRDPATGNVLWSWQELDYTLIAMTATRDGSLVAVVRNNTIILLRRDGDTITRSNITLTDSIQSD